MTALTIDAVHLDLPAHHFNKQLCDGEAEAGAAHGFHARPFERLPDFVDLFRRNADAGIADLEMGDFIAIGEGEADFAPFRVADGVGEQVHQDLPQALFIRGDPGGEGGGCLIDECEALFRRLHFKNPGKLRHENGKIDAVAINFNSPGLNLGNIQQPFDKAGEMFSRTANGGDGFLAIGRGVRILVENLRITENSVERGAEFVAETDHVAAFRLTGRFGLIAGILKLRIGPLMGANLPHQPLRLQV